MVQSNKFFIFIFIIFIYAANSLAQNQVDIKLKQPPTNQMGVADMWNLELNNTSKEDLKIYLTGTATEEKDGLIIEGKSKVFTIKPGRSKYKYNDFTGAEVKYNNGKYKETILRTGNAPEGNYTICVTAFDESGTEVGGENCIMQSVVIGLTKEIFLIHPCELVRIDCNEPLIFTWTPMPKPEKYTFRLYETGKQDEDIDDEYIFRKKAIFEENDISGSSFKLPTSIKLEEGKRYAWGISVGNIRSKLCWLEMCLPMKKPFKSGCAEGFVAGQNWVLNGDFESGNITFTSDATYVLPTSLSWGQYTIATDASSLSHIELCGTSTGKFLAYYAYTDPAGIWRQNVPVQPNTNYEFSAKLRNLICAPRDVPDPDIQLRINGNTVAYSTPTEEQGWTTVAASWNSGSNTLAKLEIYMSNHTRKLVGIDDIVFAPCVAEEIECTCGDWLENTIWYSDISASGGRTINFGESADIRTGSYSLSPPNFECLPENFCLTFTWNIQGPRSATIESYTDIVFDFSIPGSYNITATPNCSSKPCSPKSFVLVSKPPLQIGDQYAGGIIFYLDATGEHGLVAASSDLDGLFKWTNQVSSTDNYVVVGTRNSTGIGLGFQNTTRIVARLGSGIYAAKMCDDLTLSGYSDWCLPSIEELGLMYSLRSIIGGFSITNSSVYGSNVYWSSTEIYGTELFPNCCASGKRFSDGYTGNWSKANEFRVRPIRAF